MSEPDFDALLDKLRRGESVESLLAVARPDEREVLKRCAAVHEFDAALFAKLCGLEPEVTAPSLDTLFERGGIEPVPGHDGLYRVPEATRAEHYNRWWNDTPGTGVPAGLQAVSSTFLNHFAGREDLDAEALYHELIIDRNAGLEHFEALYRKADADFDHARCEDLIEVVTERLALLGVGAAKLVNHYRRRLRARTMWLADWHRTTRFLPPAGSTEAVDALLRGEHGRVLVLWSPGGMGKSSHMRWLIARHCVPADDACARIDFDEIDHLLVTREPALLLLEAAHQLDQQLPEAPFHELLKAYAGQRERLYGSAATAPARLDELAERFAGVLRDLPAGRRVVLALDTLETALLVGGPKREQTGVAELLKVLANVVQRAGVLRLVVASRYPLSDRVGEFAKLFPDANELRVPPFSPTEARDYVERYRGITRPELVQCLVRLADGMPFRLELLADYVDEHPDVDPEMLAVPAADVGVRYVMERILGLLAPDLAELVRYGAVPRVLERSFAREVLEPLLDVDHRSVDELWVELKRYAGTASWVTLESGDVDAVRFHESVRDSLLGLLADAGERPVQLLASQWYEQRAGKQPSLANQWLCEAVYHRFQYEGPAAEAYWSEQIARARREQRPGRRRALAAEVLRGDYGVVEIPPETVLHARWELAVAALQYASEDVPERREAEWLEAERAREDLLHLVAETGDAAPSAAQLALLDAGLRLREGDLDGASPQITVALGDGLSHEDRLWLTVAEAECAAGDDLGDPAPHFRQALAVAEAGPRPVADRAVVLLRLARREAQRDRYDAAAAACEQALIGADGRVETELLLLRADLDWRTGAPSQALARLEGSPCDELTNRARSNILRIRALLAAARTREALELAEDTAARFSRTLLLGGVRQQAVAAEGRELRGKVRAALLDVDGATKDYEEAAARWSQLGATEAVCRCWVRSAELHLRGTRDINHVEVRLDQARRTPVKIGDDAWRRRTLLGAEVQVRKGRRPEAEQLVDDVIAALTRSARPPRSLIDAAQRGLAVAGAEAQPRYLELLCEQLAKVTPASARVALLAPLAHSPVLTAPTELRRRLRALVPSPVVDASAYAHLSSTDVAVLLLRDAEVERVAGHADAARRAVRAAAAAFGPDAPVSVYYELVKSAARAGDRELLAELAPELERTTDSSPLLAGSLLLQAAEAVGPGQERTRLLRSAWATLEEDGAAVTGWVATALELEAEESQRRGDGTRARTERRRAIERYEALGELARARAAAADHPAAAEAVVDASGTLSPGEARVTIRLRREDVTISVRRLGRDRDVVRLSSEPALVRELVRDCTNVGRATAPVLAHRMLDDPDALAAEIAELLRSALGRDATRPSSSGSWWDVGLRSRDTVIRALPWELAASELEPAKAFLFRRAPRTRGVPADVRAAQATLGRLGRTLTIDGIRGDRTEAALREFQTHNGLEVTGALDVPTVQRLQALTTGDAAPRVMVVRPSRRLEHTAYRGARQSGVAVDWHYELAGFSVTVLEAPTAEELRLALERRPPAILHLNVGLVDHHGTAAIDLAPYAGVKGRAVTAGRLTGTAFDALLPARSLAPLVILDITAPQARRELVTQLLLRNAFAGELVSCGNARAVLATGLRHYGAQQQLTDALIGVLARGGTVRDLLREAQLAGAGEFLPAALFARHPELRFPAPSRRR